MDSLDKAILNTDTKDDFVRQLMSSLITATKVANALPSSAGTNDYAYLATFPHFKEKTVECSDDIVDLIRAIGLHVSPDSEMSEDFTDTNSFLLEYVVSMVDQLLENADVELDSISGNGKKGKNALKSTMSNSDKEKLIRNSVQDIPKPQQNSSFASTIDNSRELPFYPRLLVKPHQVKVLDLREREKEALVDDTFDSDVSYGFESNAIGPKTYIPHPYATEINKLDYSSWKQGLIDPILPSANQPYEFIDTQDSFDLMMLELGTASAIAVDLEHHSYRSFQGFTCLIQISTRNKDFVIDSLALRLYLSNGALLDIFSNPNIVKVFHGCDSDNLWLQRDFGIYIVNCFDTFQAAKVLKLPALSLAHLLMVYCGIAVDKTHQLSDWRVRPLPETMIAYARSDTHSLLYVYDCLRRDLLNKFDGQDEGLAIVCEASKKTCLNRYEKPLFYPMGFKRLLNDLRFTKRYNQKGQSSSSVKSKEVALTADQECVLQALWNWRDIQARKNDESVLYIMTNADMMRLALAIPTTEAQLAAMSVPSVYLSNHRAELVAFIKDQVQMGGDALKDYTIASCSPNGVLTAPKKAEISTARIFTPILSTISSIEQKDTMEVEILRRSSFQSTKTVNPVMAHLLRSKTVTAVNKQKIAAIRMSMASSLRLMSQSSSAGASSFSEVEDSAEMAVDGDAEDGEEEVEGGATSAISIPVIEDQFSQVASSSSSDMLQPNADNMLPLIHGEVPQSIHDKFELSDSRKKRNYSSMNIGGLKSLKKNKDTASLTPPPGTRPNDMKLEEFDYSVMKALNVDQMAVVPGSANLKDNISGPKKQATGSQKHYGQRGSQAVVNPYQTKKSGTKRPGGAKDRPATFK